MNTDVLEELGLTPTEIKVYIALLELGTSNAKDLMTRSKTQNSSLHFSLNSLIEKGLISFVYEGKGRLYQANDPEQFNIYIEEKQKRFQSILPELKAKQEFSRNKENASIHKGKKGITEVYYRLISLDAKEYLTFGGGTECADRMGMVWWNNLHAKRVSNSLSARQIFDETVRPQAGMIENEFNSNVKYLPEDFASFQETVIVGDYVAINVFTEEPYSFLIHDPNVADSYRNYFEMLWRTAKK